MKWRKKKSLVPETKARKTPASPQKAMVYRQIFVGVVLVLLLAGILSLIAYVTRLPSLQVKSVDVVGGVTIPHKTIVERAESELIGTYIRLIPKRFSWLYPKSAIKRSIEEIDRVKQAHVELDGDKNVVIAFEEHVPFGLWCKDADETSCLFVDSIGLAFAPAPNLAGNTFVRFVTDDQPSIGAHVASVEYLKETDSFVERLESSLSLFVTHVIKVGDFDTEYQVAGGGRIKVSQSMAAAESFANLQAVLAAEEFAHIEPGSFNYIDLRFGDKVFVNEVTDEVATTTASST